MSEIDPTTEPAYQRLRDAYLTLLEDKEYRFHDQRIGVHAMENAWDDPNTKPNPIDCLVNYRTAISSGVMPDINTLIYVANCFAKYLETKGDLTLDQAFGLAPKQRAGHPLRRKKAQDDKEEFLRHMAEYRANNVSATFLEAASALYPSSEIDHAEYVERMVRYYHDDGWREIEKQMEGGRIRLEPYQPPERK